MPGKIPQTFIDELMNRIDIVDVIDARIPLKKAGRDYTACCPFHNEKTPSFTVSQTKQFYHCFGCGAHGTAIGFLIEYEHLGFIDAVEDLAASVNMEVPREVSSTSRDHSEINDLYDTLEKAANWYKQQLRDNPQAQRAVDYLKRRELSGEIAAEFGVGYAPPGWDGLLQAIGKTPEAQEKLVRTGMAVRKDNNKQYDRFRDRIMFPIHNRRGKVIAFGGRILESDPQESTRTPEVAATGPKYLNSPETPVFHKGQELYGLYEARKTLKNPQRLMVVEGYMDVIALAQHGIRYAVATLGTATTREHLETLYRVVPEVIFCFDGDRAGRAAAWRALENALPVMREGRQASFLFLPDGEDPDSLVRKEGKQAFEQRVQQAATLSEFLFDHLAGQVDMTSLDGKARLVELAKPLINRLPDGIFRQMITDRLAKLTSMQPDQLKRHMPAQEGNDNYKKNKGLKRVPTKKPTGRMSPVRYLIAMLLQNPEMAILVKDTKLLKEIELPGIDLFVQLLETLHAEPHLNTGALLERWRDSENAPHLEKLVMAELPGVKETLHEEFLDTIQHLSNQQQVQRLEYLQQKLTSEGLSDSEKYEWNQLLNSNRPEIS